MTASPPPVVFRLAPRGVLLVSLALYSLTLALLSVDSNTPWPTLGSETYAATNASRLTLVELAAGELAVINGRAAAVAAAETGACESVSSPAAAAADISRRDSNI